MRYLTPTQKLDVHALLSKSPALPEKGFEDIFKSYPYLRDEFDGRVAYVEMIFVPKSIRGNGIGKAMLKNWLNELPSEIEEVCLTAINGCSGDTLEFYKAFGFQYKYSSFSKKTDDHTRRIMILGVNGHKTASPIPLMPGQNAHYMLGIE